MDPGPDPGGPKTYGSRFGPGSATLPERWVYRYQPYQPDKQQNPLHNRYTTESSKFVPGPHNFFTFSQKQLRGSASRRMRILMRIRIQRITLMRIRILIFYLMRIRFRLFTLMRIRIRIQILVLKKRFKPLESATIGSYSIHFSLTSEN